MQKKGAVSKIKAKYSNYYQKKGDWRSRKYKMDLKVYEKNLKIKKILYTQAIDSMDENINKLFKLL